MRPICATCKCHFRPKKNGFEFVTTLKDGSPYQIWMGDLWACPECNTEIVVGCGGAPIAENFEPRFAAVLESLSPALMVKP